LLYGVALLRSSRALVVMRRRSSIGAGLVGCTTPWLTFLTAFGAGGVVGTYSVGDSAVKVIGERKVGAWVG
jgi:hypothetical protein